MGGPLAAIPEAKPGATPAPLADHPTWVCPDGAEHDADWSCCPCDHDHRGCCLHGRGADPAGTHDHECVDPATYGNAEHRRRLATAC